MADLSRFWPETLADHTFLRDRVIEAYDTPERGYHNLDHLAEVLERIDVIVAAGAADECEIHLDAVRLAAWFHDAVYGDEGDNEEASARLAEQELDHIGASDELVAEVARLVRVTGGHQVADDDVNGAVLCDADLGILAADTQRYGEYVAGVRREYAEVPDADFRAGRAIILRALIEAPALFRTAYGRAHWEGSARANIARELAALDPQS